MDEKDSFPINEKEVMDYYGYSATADLGIGIYRNFGNISTSLLMTNGEGYKNSVVNDENKLSLNKAVAVSVVCG